jgi:hypothetical protein
MSLDDIQLPAVILHDLYRRSLVDAGLPVKDAAQKRSLSYLGNNKRKVIIIVSNDETLYLPDDELNFLLGILAACKLTMDDVAIINCKKINSLSYSVLEKELKAEKIFLFGVDLQLIDLPLQFPYYQVQSFNKQVYLSAPPLDALQNDKAEKTKLWMSLKQLFSI